MGIFFEMLGEIKDTILDTGEQLIDIFTDDTDYDLEFSNAKEKYDKAVKKFNSYAGKYRYRCSAIKKIAENIEDIINQINGKTEVLNQFLKDEKTLAFLTDDEKQYLVNYSDYISPIDNLNAIKECIPNYNKKAKEWNTSLEVDQDDVISFLIGGPLGVVINRAPTGYTWNDISEIEESTEEVLKQVKKVQKKVITVSKLKSELEIKQRIYNLILEKIIWYEKYLSK